MDMDTDNLLNLKWSLCSDNMMASLRDLRANNKFCDVVIVTKDTVIECHKFLLSSCSGFFNKVLASTHSTISEASRPVIYLHGVSAKCINNIITFMYEGELVIDGEDLTELFSVSADLEIKGLSQENKQPGKTYFNRCSIISV